MIKSNRKSKLLYSNNNGLLKIKQIVDIIYLKHWNNFECYILCFSIKTLIMIKGWGFPS